MIAYFFLYAEKNHSTIISKPLEEKKEPHHTLTLTSHFLKKWDFLNTKNLKTRMIHLFRYSTMR